MKVTPHRKTKIVATIGPSCSNPETLLELASAGVDVFRLNFSHGDHEIHKKTLDMVREINEKQGTHIAILQDLQGPKIRVGELKEAIPIEKGQIIALRSDIIEYEGEAIPVRYETLAKDVNVGDPILFDDGKVSGTVVEVNGENEVRIKVEFGSEIKSRKGVNLPQTNISIPTITEKDFADMDFAIEQNVEWVALSFVRSADDVKLLKELIRLKNGNSKVIAKIEKPEALKNIDEIIAVADGIMVARGDLGVEIPLEEVPIWQKRIIRKSNEQGKPVIVATQVMESMIENPMPTRAEANDVANSVIDGADAVMLSGETSVGAYPVEVIGAMDKILRNVEQEDSTIYYRHMDTIPQYAEKLSTSIIVTACKLAQETDAKAILAMTNSGYTAYQLARCRPRAQIFAFTNNPTLINVLSLVWGIRAFFYDGFISTDKTIEDVQSILIAEGLVRKGDILINTGSLPLVERGLTNMVKISLVGKKGLKRGRKR